VDDEMSFLPHTLSFFGHVSDPLTGLDADFLNEVSGDDAPLSKVLMRMMTAISPEAQAQRLTNIPDPWPVPQVLTGKAWQENDDLPAWKADERKLFLIFKQLVNDRRKSTRYYQAFTQLCHKYPQSETLQHLRCSYLGEWESPQVVRQEIQTLLQEHPGWLFLRLQWARSFLHEEHPEPENFRAALQDKLLLEQHLPDLEGPLTDLLIYQFHLELYLFFCLQRYLPRAAWCFNVCCTTVSEPEIMESLAPFILAAVDLESSDPAFQHMLQFLKP